MTRQRPAAEPAVTCAAPGCHQPVHRTGTPGRPPIYCSPDCPARTRRPTTSGGPLQVEIDHAPTPDASRPTGRVWLVRLRRGTRTVTIADNLGRPTAQDLAARLSTLIRTPTTHQGAATD